MTHQQQIEQIENWLQEEKTGYIRLLVLVREQSEALDVGNESRALGVVEKKKKLIDTIQQIEGKIAEQAKALPETEFQKMFRKTQALQDEIESLIKEIMPLEEACVSVLKERKGQLQEELQGVKQGRALLKSYGKWAINRPSISKNI